MKRYFAVRSAVVVDEGGRTEPQLGTVLTTRVHHTEVIHSRTKKPRLLVMGQLREAADKTTNLLSLQPSPPITTMSNIHPFTHSHILGFISPLEMEENLRKSVTHDFYGPRARSTKYLKINLGKT